MASGTYNSLGALAAGAGVGWESATQRILLVKSSYTYDPDHATVADVAGQAASAVRTAGPHTSSSRASARSGDPAIECSSRQCACAGVCAWACAGTCVRVRVCA